MNSLIDHIARVPLLGQRPPSDRPSIPVMIRFGEDDGSPFVEIVQGAFTARYPFDGPTQAMQCVDMVLKLPSVQAYLVAQQKAKEECV